MALITCKDCGKEFSTDAKKCPNCGAKAPYRWSWWKIAIGVFVVLVAVNSVMHSSDPESRERSAQMAAEIDAEVLCKKAVRQRLKAPSTADFGSMRIAAKADGSGHDLIGEVDAENAFGAKLRTKFICQVTRQGEQMQAQATLIE